MRANVQYVFVHVCHTPDEARLPLVGGPPALLGNEPWPNNAVSRERRGSVRFFNDVSYVVLKVKGCSSPA